MAEYKIVNNYMVFEEWFTDTMGVNYRVARMENQRPTAHKLMCVVNPLIAANPERWRRVKILLDGIRKSSISSLYSPEEIAVADSQVNLIYDHFRGRTLEQVLELSARADLPISFDLAFSIAMAISDIIESGSSIVISGEKSFHGFLTPDNVLVHYDGKIFLKNYGIFPYLEKSGAFFTDLEAKYGNWLVPEFRRKEKLVAQSDIYHLGYLIFKMLTGKYFSLAPTDDFDVQFSKIQFRPYLPFSDDETHASLITFFKKTLHPDPRQRFLTIREFRDYVGNCFRIEELSSITFSLAYFMNSLFLETLEPEEKALRDELAFRPPEPKKAPAPILPEPAKKDERAANLLKGPGRTKKKPPRWIWGAAAAAFITLGVGGYLVFHQVQKTKQKEAEFARKQLEQQRKLDSQIATVKEDLEKKTRENELRMNLSAEEQKKLADDKLKLQNELKKLQQAELDRKKADDEQKTRQEEQDRLKREEEARKLQEEQDRVKQAEADARKLQEDQDRLKREEEAKTKPGDLVALTEVTVRPVKISGGPPQLSSLLQAKYSGRTMLIMLQLLIDETGAVSQVRVLGTTPEDVKSLIVNTLMRWKYSPAQKDNVNVKVYMPVQFNMVF